MADLEVNRESEETHIVRGVVRLPPDSTLITDADEEVYITSLATYFQLRISCTPPQVFLLYTSLAARKVADGESTSFRGLGHIDSHQDTLSISLNIGTRTSNTDTTEPVHGAQGHSAKRKGHPKRKNRDPDRGVETLEVEIVQDKTALRSRKGDTGSVVWHAR